MEKTSALIAIRLTAIPVLAALLCMMLSFGCAPKGPKTISVDPATGAVPLDDAFNGPQITRIRMLREAPYLEIYWDMPIDETEAINFHNFTLHNGSKTIRLTKGTLSSGSTDSLYFDRTSRAVAASEAHCMDRLDENLHMSSFRLFRSDEALWQEIVPEGLALEVTGSAIKDADGKPARDAVYTGIPTVEYYTQFLTSDTGILIKADDTVDPESLKMAAAQVDIELGKTETKLAETMRNFGCSLAIYSPHQNMYLLPEHRAGFRLNMYLQCLFVGDQG